MGHQPAFPKHLTPGFPYAWATLVVFFLKSCREHQVITQVPVETCYLSYLSTLEQSSSTNKITPRTKKNWARKLCVSMFFVLLVRISFNQSMILVWKLMEEQNKVIVAKSMKTILYWKKNVLWILVAEDAANLFHIRAMRLLTLHDLLGSFHIRAICLFQQQDLYNDTWEGLRL